MTVTTIPPEAISLIVRRSIAVTGMPAHVRMAALKVLESQCQQDLYKRMQAERYVAITGFMHATHSTHNEVEEIVDECSIIVLGF